MIPLAVQAFYLRVAAYCPLIRSAPNHIPAVLARSVWSSAVSAIHLLVAALALDVAPFTIERAEAVGARIQVRFDFLSYSCSNHTFIH